MYGTLSDFWQDLANASWSFDIIKSFLLELNVVVLRYYKS